MLDPCSAGPQTWQPSSRVGCSRRRTGTLPTLQSSSARGSGVPLHMSDAAALAQAPTPRANSGAGVRERHAGRPAPQLLHSQPRQRSQMRCVSAFRRCGRGAVPRLARGRACGERGSGGGGAAARSRASCADGCAMRGLGTRAEGAAALRATFDVHLRLLSLASVPLHPCGRRASSPRRHLSLPAHVRTGRSSRAPCFGSGSGGGAAGGRGKRKRQQHRRGRFCRDGGEQPERSAGHLAAQAPQAGTADWCCCRHLLGVGTAECCLQRASLARRASEARRLGSCPHLATPGEWSAQKLGACGRQQQHRRGLARRRGELAEGSSTQGRAGFGTGPAVPCGGAAADALRHRHSPSAAKHVCAFCTDRQRSVAHG